MRIISVNVMVVPVFQSLNCTAMPPVLYIMLDYGLPQKTSTVEPLWQPVLLTLIVKWEKEFWNGFKSQRTIADADWAVILSQNFCGE